MTLKEQIMKLQTYKMFEGEDTVYVERDDVIKVLEQEPKMLDTIDFAIDASNGDTNYFVGFRNGLRYTKSLIDGEEPKYESCAEQQPKIGHWIFDEILDKHYYCSECKSMGVDYWDYCPNCGAEMVGDSDD